MIHTRNVFNSRWGRAVAAAAILFCGAWSAARAEEPPVLGSSELIPASWEGDRAEASVAAADPIPMSLSERVAELEKQLHEMQSLQTAMAEEDLPAGEKPKPECKELEIITKPTFTPTGRIYFDGVMYDDDPATTQYFNTDRENEFGLRTFRIGG
jgi:hypothetical protein